MDMWTDSARRQYQRLGSRYASDLTDEEFALQRFGSTRGSCRTP